MSSRSTMWIYPFLGVLLLCGCVRSGLPFQPEPREDCPPLTISNHSAWSEFFPEGSNPILWQVFCTEQAGAQLTGFWSFSNGPIGPHSSTKESYSYDGGTCTKFSLQLFSVTFAASAGWYTISAESSCGLHTNQTFLLSVSGCPCDDVHLPVPYPERFSKYIAVSNTSRNISLEAVFWGCADDKYYSVVVEHSAEIVCKNNVSLSSNYKCDQSVSNECLFFQRIVIVDYSPDDSGDYCFSAVSVTGKNNSSSCIHTDILPWPAVSGPSGNVTTDLFRSATLQWTVHNFSDTLNITAFKDKRQVVLSRIIIVAGTNDVIVYIDIPKKTSGYYQLFLNFSDNVNTTNTGFQPIWSSVGSVNIDWKVVLYLGVGSFIFLVITLLLCCVCILCVRSRLVHRNQYHRLLPSSTQAGSYGTVIPNSSAVGEGEGNGTNSPIIHSMPLAEDEREPSNSTCGPLQESMELEKSSTSSGYARLYPTSGSKEAYLSSSGSIHSDEHTRLSPSIEDTFPAHAPLNTPENFIDPGETIDIDVMGRLYHNSLHGITLRVPEGAVSQGVHLRVTMGVCLYGRFTFPQGLSPVSAIVWLCTDSQINFLKPIEVIIPHFLECENDNDAASLNMSFMKASHWDQPDGKIQFLPAEGQAEFSSIPNKGILRTNHFCYLCIAAPNLPKILERQLFYLSCAVPRTITSWSDVYFYITYLNDTCLKDMESKLPEGYSVKEQRIFKFSVSRYRLLHKPAITSNYSSSVKVTTTLQPRKITMDEVNFWKLHKEGVLEVMHEEKLYPPYMKLTFGELSLSEQLVVTVSFAGTQERTKIEIIVPRNNGVMSHSRPYTSDTMSRPAISDIPRLDQLRVMKTRAPTSPIRLLEALAPQWETLGDTIGFDDIGNNVQLIKIKHEREGPVACCKKVFQEWLKGKGGYQPPTWENLIQLLKDIDHNNLARAVRDSFGIQGPYNPYHPPLY